MRAFIHGFQGKPYNSDCGVARDGFQQLGIEPVLFTTNEEFDERNPEDVVVGGVIIMWHALNQRGITAEHYDYPEELKESLGRKIWKAKLKDLCEAWFPVFMKPVEEIIGIQFYYGEREKVYDRSVIDAAVKAYPNMPAAACWISA